MEIVVLLPVALVGRKRGLLRAASPVGLRVLLGLFDAQRVSELQYQSVPVMRKGPPGPTTQIAQDKST